MDSVGGVTSWWIPTSEADLAEAAAAGLLDERHYLDIKRELASGRGANRELARDLASFAVDGGRLIIGVDEDGNPPRLHPVAVPGLAERIEQVARSAVDPPLAVENRVIPVPSQPDLGYLIVTIPASAVAPHMVDNAYWGRGDKIKHKLADAEVARLLGRRRDARTEILKLLENEVARDPTPDTHREHAHLFVVAEPVLASYGLAARVIRQTEWVRDIRDFVDRRAAPKIPLTHYEPDLPSATRFARRPDGWALTDSSITSDRILVDPIEKCLIELEISEEGGIRIFSGRASDRLTSYGPGDSGERVFEVIILGLTHRAVALAAALSQESGYWGPWDFGVAIEGLRGARSRLVALHDFVMAPPYAGDNYRAVAQVPLQDLIAAPADVVGRLCGRLLRSLESSAEGSVKALIHLE